MNFPIIKHLIIESKILDVIADELIELTILTANSGLGAEGKQKVKDLFKELHSAKPDLNRIHAEIEELEASIGAKENPAEEKAEKKILGSGASLGSGEVSVLEMLLNLNIKLQASGKRSEYRDELIDLKNKIGKINNSEIIKRVKEIEDSL